VTGTFGGDVSEQVRDNALRKVVCLDLIGDRETLQLGHQSLVAAYYAPNEALVTKMIESKLLSITLAGGVDQRQVARLWDRGAVLRDWRMRRTASVAVTIFPLSSVDCAKTSTTASSPIWCIESDSSVRDQKRRQ
jgi:hypothetical protein